MPQRERLLRRRLLKVVRNQLNEESTMHDLRLWQVASEGCNGPGRLILAAFRIVLALSVAIGASAEAASPWYAYGPFQVGMSREAAKKIGIAKCDFGKGGGEFQSWVYCDIPVQAFYGRTTAKARAAFEPPKHETLTELRFDVPVSGAEQHCAVMKDLAAKIGGLPLPSGGKHGCGVRLHREGDEEVSLYGGRFLTDHLSVTIKFDPEGKAQRVKMSKELASSRDSKEKTLQGFK